MNEHTNGNNGNGAHKNGNGNGHSAQGIFSLQRTVEPDTIAVLEARRNCRADTRLNRSMKSLFDEIGDRALNPSFYDEKGVVTISDPALAEVFGTSARSIFTWKKMLEACGYIWITKKFKANMWPLTTYHLSCLHKPQRQQKTDPDGTFGGRKLRSAPVNPGLGARTPGQRSPPLPGSTTEAPKVKTTGLQAISGESRILLRASPEEFFGSEPKPASGESRSQLRARAEASFGREPKNFSGESRRILPVRPEADCRLKKAEEQVQENTKGEGTPPPPEKNASEGRKDQDPGFPEWCASWKPDDYRSKYEKEASRLRGKLNTCHPDVRDFWQRRFDFIRERLDGGRPATVTATKALPTKPIPQGKRMSPDEMKRHWNAAKKISPSPVAAGV